MLIPVDSIPDGLKDVPLEDGRVVLAHGEVTGHAHALVADVDFLAFDLEDLDNRFLRVEAERAGEVDAWKCENAAGEVCFVPAYTPEGQIAAAGLDVLGREVVIGVPLEHEEHLHQVVAPGEYRVHRQREYQDEAPAYVAD